RPSIRMRRARRHGARRGDRGPHGLAGGVERAVTQAASVLEVTTRVLAAGGVVARTADDGTHQIALIHRPKYDDWSLPKGKLLPGEAFEDAAVREVEEETGIRCALGPELGSVEYLDARGRPKLVRYFV